MSILVLCIYFSFRSFSCAIFQCARTKLCGWQWISIFTIYWIRFVCSSIYIVICGVRERPCLDDGIACVSACSASAFNLLYFHQLSMIDTNVRVHFFSSHAYPPAYPASPDFHVCWTAYAMIYSIRKHFTTNQNGHKLRCKDSWFPIVWNCIFIAIDRESRSQFFYQWPIYMVCIATPHRLIAILVKR